MNRDERHALTVLDACPDGITSAALRRYYGIRERTMVKLIDAGLVSTSFARNPAPEPRSPLAVILLRITQAGTNKLRAS